MNPMRAIRAGLTIAVATALLSSAAAAQAEDAPECFDALVTAKIVRQTPSVYVDCGEDCIIMVWPWFLELDVKRVVQGRAPKGRLLTLAMQHTSFRKNLGTRRWWLRRNSLGGFNVLRLGDEDKPALCASDAPPAVAYIRPGPNGTLDDLVREAREAEGRP